MEKACKSFGSLLSKRARSLDNAHRTSAMSIGYGMISSRRDCRATFVKRNGVDATTTHTSD
jgi:hypothetical protein